MKDRIILRSNESVIGKILNKKEVMKMEGYAQTRDRTPLKLGMDQSNFNPLVFVFFFIFSTSITSKRI
jgi:hypothetical protein